MPDFGSATYRLMLDATRFRAGFYDAARVANSFSRRLSATMMRAGVMLQKWGRDLTLFVTGPLALFAKSSIQTFQEFQATMRKTAGIAEIGMDKMDKRLRGAALEKQLDKVSQKIIKMGLGFGQTAQDMAEGLYFISSAGFKAQSSMKILRSVAMSSAAGLGETEDVALAVVGAIQAYALKAKDAARITDTLSMAVRKGVAESDALAKVLGTVLGPARDAGVEFDEVAGAVALMTRSSMPAARAATSLRSILMRFQDPTEEVANGLKKMGLSAGQVRVMMDEAGKTFPFIAQQAEEMAARGEKVSDQMLKGYGGLQNTLFAMKEEMGDAKVRAAELFDSIRAQPGFNAMIASVESANDVMGNTSKAMAQIGSAAKQNETSFQIMSNSLDFALKKFNALTDALQIRLGEMLEPKVRKFAETMGKLIDGFLKLPETAQDQVLKMAGAAAALGPALMVLGGLLKGLTMFATPVGAVVGGFGALAAALAVFAVRSPKVARHIKDMGKELGGVFKTALEKAKDLWDLFVDKLEQLGRAVWPSVKRFLEEASETLSRMGDVLKPVIAGFMDLASTALPVALDLLTTALGILKSLLGLIDGDGAAALIKWAILWWGVNKALNAVLDTGRLLTALPLFRGVGGAPTAGGGAPGGFPMLPIAPTGGSAAGQAAYAAKAGNYSSYMAGLGRATGGVQAINPSNFGGQIISRSLAKRDAIRNVGMRLTQSPYYTGTGGQMGGLGGYGINMAGMPNPYTGMPTKVGAGNWMRAAGGTAMGAIRGFPGALRGGAASLFGKTMPRALGRGVGRMGRLGVNAGKGLAAGAKGMLTPLNLAMVVGVSALAAWEKHKEFTNRMATIIADTVENLEAGNTSMGAVRKMAQQKAGEADESFGAISRHAFTNPIESIMNMFGMTKSKYEQATEEAEKLEQAADKYETKLNRSLGRALGIKLKSPKGSSIQQDLEDSFKPFQQYGDGVRKEFGVLFNILKQRKGITDEEARQVAGLIGHYKELNGGMKGLSMATVHTYLRSGMLEEALSYLNGEMDDATKNLRDKLTKALKDMALPMEVVKNVAKEWVQIALSAQKLTRSQRVALTQTAGVLEQSGVFEGKKGEQRQAIFSSLFESGNFSKALEKAMKWLRGPDNEATAKSLVKSIDKILLPGVRNALRGSAFLGAGRTVTGKKQQPIDGMFDGFVGAKFGTKNMFFSKSARKKMTKGLVDAFGEAGVKIPDQLMADIEKATKKDKWKAALSAAIKVGATTKDAETALGKFKETLSRQEVDVLVEASSSGGGGGGKSGGRKNQKKHSGGHIRGRTMADVPATLQEGEYVVRRSAAQKFAPLLEKINTYHEGGRVNFNLDGLGEGIRRRVASATGMLGGGSGGGKGGKKAGGVFKKFEELYHESIGTSNEHVHIGDTRSLVALGKAIERKGFDVWQHPQFGAGIGNRNGTVGSHMPGSMHYDGNAIDVNWYPKSAETGKLRQLMNWLTGGNAPAGGGGGGGGPSRVSLGTPGGWKVNAKVRGLAAAMGGAAAGHNIPVGKPGSSTAAMRIGKQMAAKYGWNAGPEWGMLRELWTRESGWEPGRLNTSSLATGIPQALPGTKIYGSRWHNMPQFRADGKLYLKGADANKEIAWGLRYIKDRYGSPSKAISWHNSHNWYSNGGYARKPHAGVFGERNGRPADEVVMPLDSNTTTRAMSRAFTRDTNLARNIGAAVAEHMPAGNDGDIVVQVDGYELGRVQRRRRILNGDH